MSELDSDLGHGHSTAAWTAVVIMLIGITIGTVAFFTGPVWLVWAGAVVTVAGLIAGWALARAGYGVDGDKHNQKAH